MLAEYHHCQHLISKQWMIQQHCCLAAVFDVDVDLFQKKKNSFKDFDRLKSNLYLYNNPMDVNVDTATKF